MYSRSIFVNINNCIWRKRCSILLLGLEFCFQRWSWFSQTNLEEKTNREGERTGRVRWGGVQQKVVNLFRIHKQRFGLVLLYSQQMIAHWLMLSFTCMPMLHWNWERTFSFTDSRRLAQFNPPPSESDATCRLVVWIEDTKMKAVTLNLFPSLCWRVLAQISAIYFNFFLPCFPRIQAERCALRHGKCWCVPRHHTKSDTMRRFGHIVFGSLLNCVKTPTALYCVSGS